ncbi:choice-of-anchor tandem repeat GloVer-containing protein [uncultured Polaribacter sp.]|uniref:choice-of-anchor tandem repeat GloVer-containing protein n=1 Tax=uncultured Polaribacter sp. TaxID=174711 RepID=UPI0026316F2D|nr:choice-of-anchor tandem repeat GloVer-containing protein [uncultured Polaribacter sp.]
MKKTKNLKNILLKLSFGFLMIMVSSCTKETINIYQYEQPITKGLYMYGTTYDGGANDLGVIYKVDQSGQNYEKVYDFETATGSKPIGGLTLANNGKLYGFTTADGKIVNPGAAIALGTFYEFDPLTNSFVVIEYIDDQSAIGNFFLDAPILSADGLLYMASQDFGLADFVGKLSSFNPTDGTFTVLETFTNYFGQPKSKLLEASDGNLYITTFNGGTSNKGAIVKYNKALNSLERLYSSSGNEFRSSFNNQLYEASNGVLYGSSREGGSSQQGCVFKINKDGSGYETLFSMVSGITAQGSNPEGGFVEFNGLLYGTTTEEEVHGLNSGTIYTVDINTNSIEFTNTLDLEGRRPLGTFVQSTNERLYVTCEEGGGSNKGAIIELNTLNGKVAQRYSFDGNNGFKPQRNQLTLVDFSKLN